MDVGSHIIHNLIVTTLVFLSIRISTSKQTLGKQQPHIVLIVADDLVSMSVKYQNMFDKTL